MSDNTRIDLDQLDELETLALAADLGEGQHVYTNPRDSNNWKANDEWHRAASPEVFLALIAIARRSLTSGAPAEAIAADRRKQAALTQMIELGQEIEASSCVGYEGKPKGSNNPCAVCERSAPAVGTVEKDAARWRETLMHVGGTYTDVGAQRFTLRYLNPVEGADIMKGSVAGHFTAAIDAVIEAHNKAGEERG